MKKIYLLFFTFWGVLQAASPLLRSGCIITASALPSAPNGWSNLFNHGLEVDHFGYEDKKHFTAELSDADVQVFKKNGIAVTYLIKDLEKNYQKVNEQINKEAALNKAKVRASAVATPTNFNLGSYAGYYSFSELPALLDQMRALYPNLISAKTTIGTSVQGRPLYMVRISDNPTWTKTSRK